LPGSTTIDGWLQRLVPGPRNWLRRRDFAYLSSALAAPHFLPQTSIATRAPIPGQHAPLTRPALPPGVRTYKVHQFHSGSAVGDAITNAMFLMQAQLRALGYESDIFVEHRAP